MTMRRVAWLAALTIGWATLKATAAEPPQPPVSPDGSASVTLFAAEPDVVTPIGATVDAQGRLFLVESQSHFRPKDYKGPPSDRIRLIEDTDGDGKADKVVTWYEGESGLMNLAADPRDGSVVVSSRNEVFRLHEQGGRGAERTTIVKLETSANYPHNGLHGLAVGGHGYVYVGIGENLGGPWTLVGADGRKVSDDTGSGAVFRVDAKGNGLVRLAHGFWNPFGLGIDPLGSVWAVDNDPDGRPPCRLIHVLQGGDYGFQFRFGRTGMHPLQAWDGELPGTLKMVAGVGEAPGAVVWHDGMLLVSSWRDHQLQGFTITPHGGSYTAEMKVLLTGGEDFRPVGIANARDGSVFVTDWGSASYPVHGKGRVWKVKLPKSDAPPLRATAEMTQAVDLRKATDVKTLLPALGNADAAVALAARFGLSKLPEAAQIELSSLKTPEQRVGLLAALLMGKADVAAAAQAGLKDPDERVRQMAVRCISERAIIAARPDLEALLQSQTLSPRLLAMTVATIGQLDGDKAAKVDAKKINAILEARLKDEKASDEAKAAGLRMMMASHPKLPIDELKQLAASPPKPLQLEAVRYLNDDADPARFALLTAIAQDAKADEAVRAEAVVGLAADAESQADLLTRLAGAGEGPVAREALRSLRPVSAKLTADQRTALADVAKRSPASADLVKRTLGDPLGNRPGEDDVAAWEKVLAANAGDPDAGRRLFYHPAGPGCFNCHMIEGRGRQIGPDLTMIGNSKTRQHVLESILQPSKEIAPLYTLWTITTKEGNKVEGMLLRRDGQATEVYVDSAGKETKVQEKQVADRKLRKESIMPTGLVQGMTDQELRDLVSFLMQKR